MRRRRKLKVYLIYPFTEPAVSPSMKNRLNIKYTTIIGISAMDDPANIRFQEDAASPELFRFIIPTIKGILSGLDNVNTIGIR